MYKHRCLASTPQRTRRRTKKWNIPRKRYEWETQPQSKTVTKGPENHMISYRTVTEKDNTMVGKFPPALCVGKNALHHHDSGARQQSEVGGVRKARKQENLYWRFLEFLVGVTGNSDMVVERRCRCSDFRTQQHFTRISFAVTASNTRETHSNSSRWLAAPQTAVSFRRVVNSGVATLEHFVANAPQTPVAHLYNSCKSVSFGEKVGEGS